MFLKFFATALLLPAFILLHRHAVNDDLPWSGSRRLTWSDFKSRPDARSTHAALTSSKIIFNYGYGSDRGFNFTIQCVFDKSASWGRVKTPYILSHEQGHFDIAEIYARKLNKAMKDYHFNEKKVAKDVPELYQSIMKEEATCQAQYDNESDFSRNKEEQEFWLTKIQDQLRMLQAYAAYKP